MATSSSSSNSPRLLLLLSIFLCFLSISASARPCKTLFISSYSFSIKPVYPNPNPNNPSSSGLVTIVTEIRRRDPSTSGIFFNRRFFPVILGDSKPQRIQRQQQSQHGRLLPFSLSSSYDISSLRDRTKDILSVVVALLFGIGCGALTAAAIYMVLFFFSSSRYYDYGIDEEDGTDNNDDVFSPKKMGYVQIPEPIKVVKEAAA